MTGFDVPIEPVQSLELELPPSCVEFCPVHPSYFLIGTYNLQTVGTTVAAEDELQDVWETCDGVHANNAQSRNGSIEVFELCDERA